MKNILVAVDGSDDANKALDIAATLATANDAAITLVHVATDAAPDKKIQQMIQVEYADELMQRVRWRQPPSAGSGAYAGALMAQHADTSDAVRSILGERVIANASKRLHAAGVDQVTTVFESESHNVADKIVSAAKEHKVDTIVMGTRGMSDLRGAVMGSVSHTVAHVAPCDVILVH